MVKCLDQYLPFAKEIQVVIDLRLYNSCIIKQVMEVYNEIYIQTRSLFHVSKILLWNWHQRIVWKLVYLAQILYLGG